MRLKVALDVLLHLLVHLLLCEGLDLVELRAIQDLELADLFPGLVATLSEVEGYGAEVAVVRLKTAGAGLEFAGIAREGFFVPGVEAPLIVARVGQFVFAVSEGDGTPLVASAIDVLGLQGCDLALRGAAALHARSPCKCQL